MRIKSPRAKARGFYSEILERLYFFRTPKGTVSWPRKYKAQAALEFTVTFVIMMVLLFGLLSLWKKWTDKIIDRQIAYNQGRVGAGDPTIINPNWQPPAY